MAEVNVVFGFGSSDWQGLFSEILQIPDADWQRYQGLPMQASFADDVIGRHPFDAPFPGVKMLTVKLPWAVNTQTTIVTGGAGDTLTYLDAPTPVLQANQIGSWVVIKNNTTGQGQFRRIIAGTGTRTIQVDSAWSPAVANNGTIAFLSDFGTTSVSHRFNNAGSSLSGTIAKSAGVTPDFTAALIGSHVMLPSATAGNVLRRITAVPSVNTLTVEDSFSALPASDTAIVLLAGAGSAQSLTGVGPLTDALSFRDLQAYYGNSTVLLTGNDYPNNNMQPAGAGGITGAPMNCMYELLWQFRARFPGTICGCSLGIDSATISPFQVGDTLRPFFFSWQKDMDHRDFNPTTTNSLYTVLTIFIAKIRTLLAAQGDTPKFHFFNLIYENDLLDQSRVKVTRIGDNTRLLRDSLRTLVNDPRAPFIMVGPGSTGYAALSVDDYHEAYRQLLQVAADDTASGLVDTRTGYSYAVDGLHYTTASQIQLGKDCYAKWAEVYERANDAARIASELPTLATLRTRVRRRYERSDVGNDATPTQIDMFLNDSIREFYNTLGDEKAWFLRRIEEVDVESGVYPNTITLPRVVKRLLRIESQSCPGMSLVWKGIGHTDAGRTQVSIHNAVSGPFLLHFIALTKDLVGDTDVAVIPDEYVELVVILTCKRLTECAGNITMAAYYAAEAERMWRVVKRSCQLHDRMRQGQMEALNTYDATTNAAWHGGDEWGL